jgi:hypothetical protein
MIRTSPTASPFSLVTTFKEASRGIVISCVTKQTGWNANTVAGKKLGIYYNVKLTTFRQISMIFFILQYVPLSPL